MRRRCSSIRETGTSSLAQRAPVVSTSFIELRGVTYSDIQASGNNPVWVETRFKPTVAKRGQVLCMGEEPKFMMFGEMPYSLGTANEVVEIQNRHSVPKHVHIHARNFEFRLINKCREHFAGMKFFRCEPRFYDKDSS